MLFYISTFVLFFIVLPLFNVHGYSFGFIPFFFFFPFFFGRNRSKNTNSPSSTSQKDGKSEEDLEKEHKYKKKEETYNGDDLAIGTRQPNRYRLLYFVGLAIIMVGVLIVVFMLWRGL